MPPRWSSYTVGDGDGDGDGDGRWGTMGAGDGRAQRRVAPAT